MMIQRLWPLVCLTLVFGCMAEEEKAEQIDEETFDFEVCADGPTVDGIDVSYWQGTVDWNAVAADGIEFAFIRVSDGVTTFDTQFPGNWAGARQAGIIRGVYQFFRPGQDAIAQADLLLSNMGTLEPDDLPPVIDVEATDGQPANVIVDKIGQWLNRVEAATGRQPIIYTGKYFWQDNVGTDIYSSYPLWIAQYGPVCPDLPNQWQEWVFFQTSSTGSVNGIAGNVDTNLFNGNIEDLLIFTGGVAECGDGRCSGGEDNSSCPEDCPICESIPDVGRIVDDNDLCFEAGGDPQWIRLEENAGYGGSLQWTHATDSADVENYGLWTLDFDDAGRYRVDVYTAAGFAQSQQARYEVHTAAGSEFVTIDQSAVDGWQSLGEFEFGAGSGQWIRLDDNTGEPLGDQVQISLDAVQLTRLDLPQAPDAGPGVGSDAGDPGIDEPMGGCGCATAARPDSSRGAGMAILMLFAWFGVRSRRS